MPMLEPIFLTRGLSKFHMYLSQCAFKEFMNDVVRWESYGGYWKRTDQHHRKATIEYGSTMVSIKLCPSTQQATYTTMRPFTADFFRLYSIFQDVYWVDDGPSYDTRYRTAEHSEGERGIVALTSMVGRGRRCKIFSSMETLHCFVRTKIYSTPNGLR